VTGRTGDFYSGSFGENSSGVDNPIEPVFAKLKHLPRKAAAHACEAVCSSIGQLLGNYTPEECAKYFKNSGYIQT